MEMRNTILLIIGLCVPLVGHAQFVPPGITATETEQLADGLYGFRWGAYRSIFIVTDAGVIVTDPISAEAADRYRAEIAKLTDQPVKYVVYSHSHWDHIAGGQIFKDEGATFVAQARCLSNLRESPHPDVVLPDITFEDHYEIELGGQGLALFYFGPIHDTCLAVMIPRPHRMIYTVDIVTPLSGWYLPWDPMKADFHFYNAVAYLREVEALVKREGIDTVIGAHLVPVPAGEGRFRGLPSTGPVTAIRERRQFWEQTMAAVKAEIDRGTVSFMVSERVDLTPFEDARGFNEADMRTLLTRIASYYAIGR